MAHCVLVVEGEAEIARHLRSALALEGYDVIVVADGHSALSLIDGAMPDLMIIDAAAPVVNGTEVTRRIRAAGMDIPIIMLASRAADTQPVAAFDAGYEQVWGYDFGPLSNLIEVYVSSLRHKLAAAGAAELIHTVRGIGYILDDHRHCQETHASANP